MKYLCIICASTVMDHLQEPEAAAHFGEYAEVGRDIKRTGHLLGFGTTHP